MTFELDGRFEWFLEEFGMPQSSTPVSQDVLEKYRGTLPNRLLEYWQEYGFCSFKDGLFWIVNPGDYEGAMEEWLAPTGIPNEDNYHVIARSGFGDLFLWGEKNGDKYVIQPRDGEIFKKAKTSIQVSEGLVGQQAISLFFERFEPRTVDLEDVDTDKSLFEQAIKKFGPLQEDEVFGFEPALFAGGEQVFSKLNKLNIHVHLSILLQLVGIPEVMDIHGLAKKAFGQ